MTQELSDHEAIRFLYGYYPIEMDRNNGPAVADCFTPDGVFIISGAGEFRGKAEIEALVRKSSEGRPLHLTHNVLIRTIDGDEAWSEAYFVMLDPSTGENVAYGTYTDRPVRCPDGRWRWKERRVQFVWASEEYQATRDPKVVPLS